VNVVALLIFDNLTLEENSPAGPVATHCRAASAAPSSPVPQARRKPTTPIARGGEVPRLGFFGPPAAQIVNQVQKIAPAVRENTALCDLLDTTPLTFRTLGGDLEHEFEHVFDF
jgi:hypothetical protein